MKYVNFLGLQKALARSPTTPNIQSFAPFQETLQ